MHPTVRRYLALVPGDTGDTATTSGRTEDEYAHR
jgi:hypothetical protein